jgi:predicted house-cleaning noncanonical NTP pyrophosphatase (MazG superfamily)
VTFEKKLIRDSDYNIIGDNSKLKSFGWVNNYDIKSLVSNMIQDEIENYKNIDTLT